MFIKLGIIAGIVILGGMIFSNEIDNLFPTTSATVLDSLKNDVSIFGSKASDSVEQRIDSSIDKIVDKTSESISDEISDAGDKISDKISETKKSSQKTIKEEISNFNPIESIQNIFTGNSNSGSTSQSSTNNISSQNTISIIPETLSLSTKQQSDDNILLQYVDTSGKTKSVNVIIRTTDKEIFSGTFFTSKFDTNVNDATGIPYYVDMVVEHEDYGTVTSSVFNPGDSSDTKINGIFSQP
jgi:YesN/AraC family two-component response regulator